MRFAEIAERLAGKSFEAGKVSRDGSSMRHALAGFPVTADGFHSPGVTRPNGGAHADSEGGGLQADGGSLI
jgi:hypothetical protein